MGLELFSDELAKSDGARRAHQDAIVFYCQFALYFLFYGTAAKRRTISRDAVRANHDSILAADPDYESHGSGLPTLKDAVFPVIGILPIDFPYEFSKRQSARPGYLFVKKCRDTGWNHLKV